MRSFETYFDALLDVAKENLRVLESASKAAYDETTHSETKSEGKYDTRAIEAGYLAGAQAERARILSEHISVVERIYSRRKEKHRDQEPESLSSEGNIVDFGSVVIVESFDGTDIRALFLLPYLGGVSFMIDKLTCYVVTDKTSLGKALKGKGTGDELEVGQQAQVKIFEITEII